MKVDLDRVEVEALLILFERRVRKRWLHRRLNPKCKQCKNEVITIDKLKDALQKGDESQ